MFKKIIIGTLCLFVISNTICSQETQQSYKKNTFKKAIIPASLITLGFILSKSALEKDLQKNILKTVKPNFHTHADDYLVLTPATIALAANFAGIEAKNHWFDQGKNVFIATTSTYLITKGLKNIFKKTRPDGSNSNAMPSGHTAMSFSAATVLYEEYKNTNTAIAYSGFVSSSAVMYFRMANNKHWVSDTLIGAGIGIAMAKLVYLIEPFKNVNPFKNSPGITVFPSLSDQGFSIAFTKQF
ncbi:MAG: phosphatase PAP2 family protein [Flavobacteriaceae bacterium]|nr:phosphatase PAP2 family protein [Flavobacteriaceae bacterium]